MGYNSNLQSNNVELQVVLDLVNELPEMENLDAELSTQDSLISQIQSAVDNLPDAGSGGTGGGDTALADSVISGNIETYESNTLTLVHPYAFAYCMRLSSVNLPSVRTIAEYAFYKCSYMETLHIPQCLYIEPGAFDNCFALRRVDLLVAKAIYENAFYMCGNLNALILRNTESICYIDPDSLCNSNIIDAEYAATGTGFVYVPTSMYEAYRDEIGYMFDEYGGEGTFEAVFRKIEDYPEITAG